MLNRRTVFFLVLFFLSEGLMLGVSFFLRQRFFQAQPVILGLFLLCVFLGSGLMKSLTSLIQRDASLQAVGKLQEMKAEQLEALVQTGESMADIRLYLESNPVRPEELEQEIPGLYVSRCANPVADAILYRKAMEMREQGIRCTLRASLPENLKLEPAVLLSLLTNLLDNASHAAALCREDQRYVTLDARMHRNCLVCICENSVRPDASLTRAALTGPNADMGRGWRSCRIFAGITEGI